MGFTASPKKVKGKRILVPIDPQPDDSAVIQLFRHYTTLKFDSEYKKWVSWLRTEEREQISVVECLGNYPCLAPHGNSKKAEEYLRTPTTVMQEMAHLLTHKRRMDVYSELTTNYKDRPEKNPKFMIKIGTTKGKRE
jgi:hypothetical protein